MIHYRFVLSPVKEFTSCLALYENQLHFFYSLTKVQMKSPVTTTDSCIRFFLGYSRGK